MVSGATGTLDEAYQRLHATGPEFGGYLSNHGPMAAEAMVRRGHAGRVHRWLDGYMRRLEEFPRGSGPIGASWQDSLGDPRRVADWTNYSATAPNAILRTLPALDRHLWAPSVTAAWAATAALTAVYAPPDPAGPAGLPDPPPGLQAGEEVFARAVQHGDEHVIKFADTATDVYARTGNTEALAAAIRATQLID